MEFKCRKCGHGKYEIIHKPNGTGMAHGLYCAQCGTWQKWLTKAELRVYDDESCKQASKNEFVEFKNAYYTLVSTLNELGLVENNSQIYSAQYVQCLITNLTTNVKKITQKNTDNYVIPIENCVEYTLGGYNENE